MKIEKQSEALLLEDKQENLLRYLLESIQNENILLAFQLISNQQVLDAFFTHFLVLSVLGSEEVKTQVNLLIKEYIPNSLQNAFYAQQPKKLLESASEKLIKTTLEGIAQIPEIDTNTLGNMTFKFLKKGASFCLKHQTNNPETILQQFLEEDTLDLSDLDLEYLPPAVGNFKNIKTLDLSGNSFSEIPTEIQQLSSLQNFFYIGTPLSRDSIVFLTEKFPRIFANKHYRRASQLYNREQYKIALKEIDKALSLYPNDHHFWNAKGIIMKRLGKLQQASFSFKKAFSKAKQKADINPDSFGQPNITIQKTWAKPVKINTNPITEKETSPKNHWEHSLLLHKANAFFKLGEYQDALHLYQKMIPYCYQDASFWYQLSTILHRLKREKGFTLAIKQAIILDKKLLKKAQDDFDIKSYVEFQSLFPE